MIDVKDIQARVAGELSLRARLAYVLLMLASLLMAGAVASLAVSEPALPARTTIAFVALIVIGISWAAFAGWMLARRRVLLAGQRVVATRMAVVFCATYTAGCLILGLFGFPKGALLAAAIGAAQTAVAVALHLRARRGHDTLLKRRRQLEAAIAAEGVPFRKDTDGW